MADKQYVTAIGMVQKFGKDKPAVTQREASGQTVYGFTIKTGTQQLIGVTLWPELAHIAGHLTEGCGVFVEGAYSASENNGRTFHNISASRIAVVPAVARQERDVVNPAPAAAATAAPVAAAQAAAPATPFSF